jgi:hypothetical protein
MCLVPWEAGPNHIPSIKDVVVGGNVGIGAVVPSGKGKVRCDGSGGALICWMYVIGGASVAMVTI